MKTTEDIFCEVFYRWWRDQTTPQMMTWEKAQKIIADCRADLRKKLVPDQMPPESFDEYMAIVRKVVLFGVSWDEAKAKKVDDFLKERRIPMK